MSWFLDLFSMALSAAGVPIPQRHHLDVDPPLKVADDPKKKRTRFWIDTDALPGSVPQSRTIAAGAGLTGGGDLSANRTIDVVAGDNSITVSANDIKVGVISDANHGARGGAELHALATTSDAGFMSNTDKVALDAFVGGGVPIRGTASTAAGFAVEDVDDDGSGGIRVTATGHPLSNGNRVLLHGVGGVPGANGAFLVTVDDADNFFLDGASFSGAYTSGGTVLRCANILAIPCPDDALTSIGRVVLTATVPGPAGFALTTQQVVLVAVGGNFRAARARIGLRYDSDIGVMHYAVGGAMDDGGEIQLSLTSPHDFWNGDKVRVEGVEGAEGANGAWTVERIDGTKITLTGSSWGSAYSGGGTVIPLYREDSVGGEWSAGVLTVWVVGSPTDPLDWTATAYEIVTN